MTDVNIATQLIIDANSDKYDTAILISGDSDLVPPIKAVHANFPTKTVSVFFPPNRHNNEKETTGALLIRNSWGKEWGDKGYGWIPYDYILNNLALDFWSLPGMDWVDSKQFGI